MGTQTIITIQNIDDEDFTFEFNSTGGNAPYLIRAGEVVRYPDFLANHAVKHLITKILNKRKNLTDHLELRQELADEIIIGEEKQQKKPSMDKATKLVAKITELNKKTVFSEVLDKKTKKSKTVSKSKSVQKQPRK